MKCVSLDEAVVPHKKRHCRASRKKRLRLKKRASLEHSAEKVDGKQNDKGQPSQLQTHQPVQTEVQVLIGQEDTEQSQRQQHDEAVDTPEPQKQEQVTQEEQDRSADRAATAVDNQDEMAEYERKRMATVLRNQAFMQTIGISIAKMAARTSIGNEAAKEARRQELAAKRAENAARKAELLNQPLRKSRRLINEERDRKARETFRLKWEVKKKAYNFRNREIEAVTAKPSAPLQHVEPPQRKEHALAEVNVHEGNNAVEYLNREHGASGDTKEETDREHSLNDVGHSQVLAQKTTVSNNDRPGSTALNTDAIKGIGRPEVDANRLIDAPTAGRSEDESQCQPVGTISTPEKKEIRSTDSTLLATRSHISSENPPVHLQTRPKDWIRSSPNQDGNKNADGGNLRTKKDAEHEEDRTSQRSQAQAAEYERIRRENILRNQAFLQQVGVSAAKFAARTLIGNEAEKAAKKRALEAQRMEKAARSDRLRGQPKRRSARLTLGKEQVEIHSTELGHPLDVLDLKGMLQPKGSKLYVMDATDSEGEAFCKEIAGGGFDGVEEQVAVGVADEMVYSLARSDVVRSLKHRVTTMTFHPRADKIIVASGDKEGHVALWSPAHGANKSAAALSRPHGFPVTKLIFPDSYTLASSSIDGTVREFDLGAAKSSLVCDLSEECGITSLIGSGNPQFYYASCEDGSLRLVDRRAQSVLGAAYALHKKRINSVDQHPSLDFCLATTSRDETVCLWDKRQISTELSVPLARVRYSNPMHGAHFSPNDGSYLVAVGHNPFFDMFETATLMRSAVGTTATQPKCIRVPYNTRTETSTKLCPAWDPKRRNRFAIGNLDSPKIQIFEAGRPTPAQEMTSGNFSHGHPVNVFHPHLDLIASGCSVGQIALWRGEKAD